MNTKLELLIDRNLARPLAYGMNFFVRLLGKLLGIDHSLDKEFERVAISKFKGMGSIVQATPMIRAIRERFPDSEILFISTRSNRALLERIDDIDRIVCLDDRGFFRLLFSTIGSCIRLMRIRPQVYFDLEIYSDFSSLFTLFTLSVNRIGFYLRSSSYRMGLYTHMMFFNPRVPISKVYLQMTRLIGCDAEGQELYRLKAREEHSPRLASPYIVVNPNASDLRLERRWGKENFVAAIRRILKAYPERGIILVGSKDEASYTESIARDLDDERVLSTAGDTSLDELISIIDGAEAMLTNDTGPMHIAFSTRTPSVCLFGPCAPEHYGIGENARILYERVYCSPCVHDFITPPCKGDNVCMQLIGVEKVMDALKELMHGKSSVSQADREPVYQVGQNVLGKVRR